MTCRCSINSLRSFVRAVAYVDISATPSVSRLTLQRPQAAIRSLPGHRTPIQCRFKSTESTSGPDVDNLASVPESSRSSKSIKEKKILSANSVSQFSLEAIDAILEESKSTPQIISEQPILDKSVDIPLKYRTRRSSERNYEERDTEKKFKPAFREAKEPNNGFSLRLSAPRAPLPTRSTSRSTRETGRAAIDDREPAEQWVPKREHWQIQKAALKEKFPDGWNPLKRLSPDAMAGIRALHAQMPQKFTTEFLANSFEISAEGIRRILKSKWTPTAEIQADRERRWFSRGEKVWSRAAELGVKPPRKWRDAGIGRGKPEWLKEREERPKPALLSYPRREGGNFGEQLNNLKPMKRNHLKDMDALPELVTTRRQDGNEMPELISSRGEYMDDEPELITTRRAERDEMPELLTTRRRDDDDEEMPELLTTWRADREGQ